jgi:hypothetical protein
MDEIESGTSSSSLTLLGPVAGSGVAPSLLRRRLERMEKKKQSMVPMNDPPETKAAPQTPTKTSVGVLSLRGLTGGGSLPESEVLTIELQLSAIRARRIQSPNNDDLPSPRIEKGAEVKESPVKFGRRAETVEASPEAVAFNAISNQLSSNSWQDQQLGLSRIHDLLNSKGKTIGPALRSSLERLVPGLLAACDCPRSSVTKSAIETIACVCRAAAAKSDQPTRLLDYYVENIATKLVLKGGSTSSKFLYDSALFALRDLVESVSSLSRAMVALLALSNIKTDKSKILWGEAVTHLLERSNGDRYCCFAGKDSVGRCLCLLDTLLHDPWGEVRECGRRLGRLLSQLFKEDSRGGGTEELIQLTIKAIPLASHLEPVMEALEVKTEYQAPTTPRTRPVATFQRPKPNPNQDAPNPVPAPPIPQPPQSAQSSARKTRVASQSAPDLKPKTVEDKNGIDDLKRAPPPEVSRTFENNSSFFQTTLGVESQQHGPFSALILGAADGNWKERVDSLEKIRSNCEDIHFKSGTVDEKTGLALSDVVALRCADANNQVQLSALNTVPSLLKVLSAETTDASSSRWVSCLTTALGSRSSDVQAKAQKALLLVVEICTPDETKSLLQCLSTTMVSVRSDIAKCSLAKAAERLIQLSRTRPTSLDRDDARFLVELSIKLLEDERPHVREAALRLCCCVAQRKDSKGQAEPFFLEPNFIWDHPGVSVSHSEAIRKRLEAAE